jgi:selenocysteine lyase/cysteine desulfurase
VTWLAQAEGLNAPPPSSKAGCRPLADVVGATTVVPLATGGEARYVNLDYAATAPSLARVAARVTEVLPWYSSVHRGAGYLCKVSTSLFESARETVHDFVGGRPDDLVIVTRNTTDALNLLSHAVPDGGEVVYFDVEHHANLLPWQRLTNRCVTAAETLEETFERLERALAQQPVSLLAVTGASNVTGETVPISRIVRLAHDYGTRVAVDAAQLAPHRPLDLSQLDADYVAFSGHKCYAPFGAGALVGRRDWLDSAPAYLPGGGAVERVTIATTEWAPAPPRHEGGTPNLLGAVALAEASVVLAELGKQGAIEAHEAALRERLLIGLASLEGIRLLRIWQDNTDAVGIVAFEMPGHEMGAVATYLASEHAIGVRDGVLRPPANGPGQWREERSPGQLWARLDDRRYRPVRRGPPTVCALPASPLGHAQLDLRPRRHHSTLTNSLARSTQVSRASDPA